MSVGDERELTRLYEGLARYNWFLRRIRGARAGEGLEMHKRLVPGTPGSALPGDDGLDTWLLEQVDPSPRSRVLDLGCGFGASLFAWTRRNPEGRQVGLSLSAYQVRMASREALRQGLAERCRFRVGNFDEATEVCAEEGTRGPRFDVILSIETLFHSADLERTLRGLVGMLEPGGRLVLVEDMAVDGQVSASSDGEELLRYWSTRRLHSDAEYRHAIEATGLVLEDEFDLSTQVRRRAARHLKAQRSRLERMQRWIPLPLVRCILGAYLGGLALERLYGADSMGYRAMIARRSDEA